MFTISVADHQLKTQYMVVNHKYKTVQSIPSIQYRLTLQKNLGHVCVCVSVLTVCLSETI